MRRFAAAAAAATLALTLGGCSSGTSTPSTPIGAGGTAASSTPVTSAVAGPVPYGATALTGATLLGAAKVGAVGIDVYLPMQDAPGLLTYARNVSTPGNPLYRRFLTPGELGDRFGASAASYAKAIAVLNSLGIATQSYPQRQMLRIRGPQSAVESFIGAKFGVYRRGTQRFLAPMSQPRPDARVAVSSLRAAVGFLRDRRQIVPLRSSHGIGLGYSPQQVAGAFDYTGAYAAGYTGTGINVGVIGTGPISDGDPRITGPDDVASYRATYRLTASGTVTQVATTNANVSPGNPSVSGAGYSSGLQTPPPVTSESAQGCVQQGYDPSVPGGNITDYTTCNPEDIEAQLDTEQIASLAPNANEFFYIAYNPYECYAAGTYSASTTTCPEGTADDPVPPAQEEGIALSDDEIQQAIGDDVVDVLSLSFGGDEPTDVGVYFDTSGQGFGPTEFASLASEGIAVFASTGDFGAQGCADDDPTALPVGYTINSPCVSYPSGDPNVVAVGGVNAPITSAGTIAGPIDTWGVQTADPYDNASSSGGGGGLSLYFPLPSYQSGVTGVIGSTRNQPDISGLADTATGINVLYDAPFGAESIPVGGTSVAAPESAAMWALVLQACRATSSCATASGAHPYRLGDPSPLLYAIYDGKASGGFTPHGTYASTFYDVQFGSNATIFQPVDSSPTPTPVPSAVAADVRAIATATPNPNATALPTTGPTPDPTYAPGYTAGVGYDQATGLGVPFARNLIRAIVGV